MKPEKQILNLLKNIGHDDALTVEQISRRLAWKNGVKIDSEDFDRFYQNCKTQITSMMIDLKINARKGPTNSAGKQLNVYYGDVWHVGDVIRKYSSQWFLYQWNNPNC